MRALYTSASFFTDLRMLERGIDGGLRLYVFRRCGCGRLRCRLCRRSARLGFCRFLRLCTRFRFCTFRGCRALLRLGTRRRLCALCGLCRGFAAAAGFADSLGFCVAVGTAVMVGSTASGNIRAQSPVGSLIVASFSPVSTP